jgi:arachidonate 5-lipoxygenase
LKRHTRYTLAINTKARNGLIDAGGIFDEFISCGGGGHIKLAVELYKKWTLRSNNIRRNLKERGVDNVEELPYYPYRDDGLLVWDAMETYVRDIVNNHYQNDEDIMNDKELQNYGQDICNHGHTSPQFEMSMVATKENVVETFTTIIWTVSCQHAAMNFGQYKYLGFPLNAPMSIYVDPTYIKKGEYDTEAKIMEKIMPSQHQIIKQISIAYILAA